MNRRSSVKAWPLPLIGRFPQRGFPIGRHRRHVMYGRAGLLIRRWVKGGGFFVTVGGCLAGLALTSWLASWPSGLGNEIPRGPVGELVTLPLCWPARTTLGGAYLHNRVAAGEPAVIWTSDPTIVLPGRPIATIAQHFLPRFSSHCQFSCQCPVSGRAGLRDPDNPSGQTNSRLPPLL